MMSPAVARRLEELRPILGYFHVLEVRANGGALIAFLDDDGERVVMLIDPSNMPPDETQH